MSEDNEQELSPGERHAQLGSRLREARLYLGLSQEFVADQLGVPRASVSALESGKRKVSGLELKQLAALYRQSVNYLLGEEEFPAQQEPADPTISALFRTAKDLNVDDRQQVLRFAQFLRTAGRAPVPKEETGEA